MTRTALKALTVAAVSAASILLGGGVALANPGDQPGDCQAGEEYQGEFGCVATQLPEETRGRQIDALPPVAVVQDGAGETARPAPHQAPQTAAPTVPVGPAQATHAPVVPTPASSPQAGAVGTGQPLWVSMDKIMQILAALLGWLF
jgi:hypothetical protein